MRTVQFGPETRGAVATAAAVGTTDPGPTAMPTRGDAVVLGAVAAGGQDLPGVLRAGRRSEQVRGVEGPALGRHLPGVGPGHGHEVVGGSDRAQPGGGPALVGQDPPGRPRPGWALSAPTQPFR